MRQIFRNYKFWLILTLIWVIVMFYLSHQNGEKTADTSMGLAEFLHKLPYLNKINIDVLNMFLRRLAHVTLFLLFTILIGIVVEMAKWTKWVLVLPFFACWFDEFTKPWIQGRHFDWFDVGLNVIGCLIGIGIVKLISYKLW